MVEEGGLVWRLRVQVSVVGACGLLKRLVKLGVLLGVGVSLGVATGEDSFVTCWITKNKVLDSYKNNRNKINSIKNNNVLLCTDSQSSRLNHQRPHFSSLVCDSALTECLLFSLSPQCHPGHLCVFPPLCVFLHQPGHQYTWARSLVSLSGYCHLPSLSCITFTGI